MDLFRNFDGNWASPWTHKAVIYDSGVYQHHKTAIQWKWVSLIAVYFNEDIPWTGNSYGGDMNFANYWLLFFFFFYFKQYYCSVSQMWWLHCEPSLLGEKMEELRAHGFVQSPRESGRFKWVCVYFLPEFFQYQFLKLCPLFWEPKQQLM